MVFNDRLKNSEVWSAFILLVLHAILFPCLISLLSARGSFRLTDAQYNVIYYAVSTALTLLLMGKFLRRSFDSLCDAPMLCLRIFLLSWVMSWALEYAVSFLIMSFDIFGDNPNQTAITGLIDEGFGYTLAMSVFLAPIVEETVFRGGIFCAIRPKNRVWAYVMSVLLFSLYHVWQYAFFVDPKYLIYMLQYIPMGFVLCWCYEKSGSVWTGIFFHMSYNYFSLSALRILSDLL